MRLLIFFFSIFTISSVSAQDDWRLYSSEDSNISQNEKSIDTTLIAQDIDGNVVIYSDSRIDSLVSYLNDNPPATNGYRVQIYFGNRTGAENRKAEFLRRYSEWPIYIVWQQPDFKVQVGDFMTKIQAEKVQHEIISSYPNAYPIFTKIKFTE